MKVLILSHPYVYSWRLAKAIGLDLGYNYVLDPFDISLPIKRTLRWIEGADELENRKVNEKEEDFPWWNNGSYSWGDEVKDNTVICHMVEHHKLPQHLNEANFLGQFTGSFDRVIAVASKDPKEAKEYACIAHSRENNNNPVHKKWNELNVGNYGWEYDDSMFHQETSDKIHRAHDWLIDFSINNNITLSYIEDFMFTEQLSDINSEIAKWDIDGLNNIVSTNGNLSGSINVFNACARKMVDIVY